MREFEVFQQIGATSAKSGKERLLKDNDTPELRTLLRLCYDPYLTYRIAKLEEPCDYNEVQPDITRELEELLEMLARHGTTPTDARRLVCELMERCTKDGAFWVARIVKRDLKIGISTTTINKVFPGLVPHFGVQLAHPVVDKKKGTDRWDKVNYPVIVEEKFDGMRVIAVCDGSAMKYFSREGKPLDLHFLDRVLLNIRPGTRFVLDGEGVGIEYNPQCDAARKAFEAGKHWEFAQALSMIKSKDKYTVREMYRHVGYKVWDVIDYDYFTTQGKKGVKLPLRERKLELLALFDGLDHRCKNVSMVENHLANNRAEVLSLFDSVRAKGGEGAVIKGIDAPYEFKRSNAVLKLKKFYTADLRIVDALEGKPGTKYEGMLGTLLVSDDNGVTGKVMGGFDDDLRVELWLRHKRGELTGGIVEVDYMEITPDNSLRHACFLRERLDKTECSWH